MTNLRKNYEIPVENIDNLYKSSLKSYEELREHSKTLLPLKQLFGNYILEQSLVLFPSERGTGKTFLGMEICITISSECNNFCGENIEKHGNTLFVNFELNEDIISRRIDKLSLDPPFKISQTKYKALFYTTRKSFQEELLEIIKIIREYEPVLVVLDNFRMAFINSDANNNKDVAKAMNQILLLKDSLKTTILLTDHTRKNTRNLLTDSDLQSGSGAKTDLTDSDMLLRRSSKDNSLRILKRMKSRNCEESNNTKLLRLNPETLWFECISDDVREEDHLGPDIINDNEERKLIAIDLSEKGKSTREIAKILDVGKTTVARWLKEY